MKIIGFCKKPSSDVRRSNSASHFATDTTIASPDSQKLNEKEAKDTRSLAPVDPLQFKGNKETKDLSVMEKLAMIEIELLSIKRRINLS